jgi:gas vesicle protein
MKKGEKFFAVGAFIGVATGYIAGILTAPKSGKETREDIKSGASKVRVEAEKQLKKLHSDLSGLIKEAEVHRKKLSLKARQELDKAIQDVEDPNLKAAVEEAKKAKKNLSAYLKKR